jgi:anti-sigma regulatory factor (Ser/Thr protein kinase)
MVRAHLEAWGLAGDQGPLELAVSELVTNAILHGRGLIDIRLSVDGDRIRLEVGDQGGGTPAVQPRATPADVAGGWGLNLVERLSDRWGYAQDGGVTRVWMERRTDRPGRDVEARG